MANKLIIPYEEILVHLHLHHQILMNLLCVAESLQVRLEYKYFVLFYIKL